jgi:YD repeat-containing protein
MDLLSPYPGLRPFDVDESHLFFGREEQTDELLQRLHATHFLGVVGPSGCGKSSLVRAGMIAALSAGFMVAAGARWQFAIMRPESRPMHGLAKALGEQTVIGSEEADKEIATGFLDATLRRGPLGVVEALRDTPLPADTNLLILVDQFEEIFRFEREGGSDEADAFVSLLLETARQREVPVYVVITMRSDFFGDCAIFEGLPEALNESQYLTPRLTREQRQAAIVGPARVFGGDVAPDLVNRLLNQMGTDPDQLPLMQHLLMRMWTWRFPPREAADGFGTADMATEPRDPGRELTLADCDAVGGLDHALSRHADEAFESLDGRQKSIAETLFRILSERAPGNRDIRRPTPAGEVAELAGASLDELVAVVEAFRAPGRSFIVPAFPEPIGAERVLDITHESLIRQWERLRDWAEEEEQSAETYRRLAQTASLWRRGESALWQPPDLDVALDWRAREQPTALWAKRYGGDFPLAMAFLAESEKARAAREAEAAAKRRTELRRWRWAFASASGLALFLLGFGIWYHKAFIAEDVQYYKNFVTRFGEPVGVGELSIEQTRHRVVSLKLVRQGVLDPVIRIEAVDAEGNCAPRNSVGTHLQDQREADNTSPLHECRWEFVYDNAGEVVYEKAYDKEGQLRWGYSYTPGERQATSRTAYYVDRDGFPARFKNSLAEIVRFDYSPRGYEVRETWMDRQERPQPVKDRAYGRAFEYDEQGREIRMTSLDQQGHKMNDTAGNATLIMAYDPLGNETDAKGLDKDDKPVLFKDGYYEHRMTYDENGNVTSYAVFDLSGRPTVDEDRIHLTKYDYDPKGYVKEYRYYDTEDRPAITKEGYHKETSLARDEHGNLLRWAYFGTADEPATDSDGVHEYQETYDSHGFPESMAAFDRDGRPTTVKQGYHKIEWQYDASGNKVSESYLDLEARPTRHISGWYRVKLAYDDRNNLIEMANFDPGGRPTTTNAGYHRWTATYNDRGFKIEEAYFGRNGEAVNNEDGYHKIKMTYDLRGNRTDISYFDANNNPVVGSEKFAHLTNAYDGRDNITESAYYGPDGRLTDRGRGYTIERLEYDNQDRVTKDAYYIDDGRLTAGPDGYAVVRWQYDGNLRDEHYFDAADHAIALNGCMIYRSIVDKRTGKRTEDECLDAQGHLMRNADGAAIIRRKYDDHGREIEKARYGEDQQLVSVPNYAIVREKYDDHGNQVEEAYFGEDEKLRLGPDGYAIFRVKYDDHGNPTENAYFGEDEKPRLHPKLRTPLHD